MPRITDEEFNRKKELADYAMSKSASVDLILAFSGISRPSFHKYISKNRNKNNNKIYNGKTIEEIMIMKNIKKNAAYVFCKKYNIKFKTTKKIFEDDYTIYQDKTIKEIMAMRKCSRTTASYFCKKHNIKYISEAKALRRKKDLYAGQRYEDI